MDASPPEPPAVGPVTRRRRRWLGWGVAVTVAGVVAVSVILAATSSKSSGPERADPLVDATNRPAPTFSLPALAPGRPGISLAALRGRPLVIDFWASWCYPCQTEMPLLESAARREAGKVDFLGIDVNDTRSAALAFVKQKRITYPVAFLDDSRGTLADAYGLIGLPTTVFVSPGGMMSGRLIGQFDQADLSAALRSAFAAVKATGN